MCVAVGVRPAAAGIRYATKCREQGSQCTIPANGHCAISTCIRRSCDRDCDDSCIVRAWRRSRNRIGIRTRRVHRGVEQAQVRSTAGRCPRTAWLRSGQQRQERCGRTRCTGGERGIRPSVRRRDFHHRDRCCRVRARRCADHGVGVVARPIRQRVVDAAVGCTTGRRPRATGIGRADERSEQIHQGSCTTGRHGTTAARVGRGGDAHGYHRGNRSTGEDSRDRVCIVTSSVDGRIEHTTVRRTTGSGPCSTGIRRTSETSEKRNRSDI